MEEKHAALVRIAPRSPKGARVKRTTITAIECVSAVGRYLNPMIIYPASTHTVIVAMVCPCVVKGSHTVGIYNGSKLRVSGPKYKADNGPQSAPNAESLMVCGVIIKL